MIVRCARVYSKARRERETSFGEFTRVVDNDFLHLARYARSIYSILFYSILIQRARSNDANVTSFILPLRH